MEEKRYKKKNSKQTIEQDSSFWLQPVTWQNGICIGFFQLPVVWLQEFHKICSADGVQQLREEKRIFQEAFFFESQEKTFCVHYLYGDHSKHKGEHL